MPAVTNPPSVGFAAIWTALNAWPQFGVLVRPGPGTQINAQASGYAPPTSAQAGDRPSFKLGEGRLVGNPFGRNSLVVEIKIAYTLQVASGQMTVDKIGLLNTVILQALTNAGPNLKVSSIYRWEPWSADVKAGGDPLSKRPEWTTFGSILVTFWINRTDFLNTIFT
jgi:hypothetical protein